MKPLNAEQMAEYLRGFGFIFPAVGAAGVCNTDKTNLQHTKWLVWLHDLEKVRQSAKIR